MLETIKGARYGPVREGGKEQGDVCLYALDYLNCTLQAKLMCYGQGAIKFGLSSDSSNKAVYYNILHITHVFQRDFVHVLQIL